jgi:uncharacterized membrane protein YphA (DoxX/SURF4 family)
MPSQKSDVQIQDDVRDELTWDPEVSITDIGVTVKDGVVTLRGTVVLSSEKWAAERDALPNAVLFSYLITFGEILVGVALILGLLTGFAAFFGGFMNASYLFAGTVSTNPVLLLLAILLVLAWRVAGYWGLDRWALPMLGVPGAPGTLFRPRAIPAPSRS